MASTTDFGLYIAYFFTPYLLWDTSLYPLYHALASSKSISYLSHNSLTSSSVKPKYSAKAPISVMEYSVNILRAECEPYFLIGSIPVMYASAI